VDENRPAAEKFGWRVSEWGAAVGIKRSRVHELIADKIIISVRFGHARIITTHPRDFLASLAEQPKPEGSK